MIYVDFKYRRISPRNVILVKSHRILIKLDIYVCIFITNCHVADRVLILDGDVCCIFGIFPDVFSLGEAARNLSSGPNPAGLCAEGERLGGVEALVYIGGLLDLSS